MAGEAKAKGKAANSSNDNHSVVHDFSDTITLVSTDHILNSSSLPQSC
jgi:hypothetical protein